ncbi:leucine-rich repeat protein [Polaribacter irgensii]|uniref:leucine-rich repeat protein n=1 Tax=Polaribacter irgensii TaxID=531 RepID=UPI0009D74C1C
MPNAVTYNSIAYSVSSIGERAFTDCTSLISVTILDTVTSIGVMAFRDCSGLTNVIIGNSATTIGKGAVVYCTSSFVLHF